MAPDIMAARAELAADTTALTAEPVLPRSLLPAPALRRLSQRSNLSGAMQTGAHLACLSATALLVWVCLPYWYLLIPAMALHGVTIVTMFAPMHECVHRTAFASRRLNDAVGWIAGVLSFYNSTFYRHFHAWHHRYTQDPARDPELIYPKAASRRQYLMEISGLNFWLRRAIEYPLLALGRAKKPPFVPTNARRPIAVSMSMQLLIYAAGLLSAALGSPAVLFFWFLPAVLAQPILRALLIVEHSGCSEDGNGLTDTRTTLAGFPIRLLMWNMPYHAEHHLYPAVPFHLLPALHREIGHRLAHVAPSYVAANLAVIRSLRT
jgi:fatty acid desaturase